MEGSSGAGKGMSQRKNLIVKGWECLEESNKPKACDQRQMQIKEMQRAVSEDGLGMTG